MRRSCHIYCRGVEFNSYGYPNKDHSSDECFVLLFPVNKREHKAHAYILLIGPDTGMCMCPVANCLRRPEGHYKLRCCVLSRHLINTFAIESIAQPCYKQWGMHVTKILLGLKWHPATSNFHTSCAQTSVWHQNPIRSSGSLWHTGQRNCDKWSSAAILITSYHRGNTVLVTGRNI